MPVPGVGGACRERNWSGKPWLAVQGASKGLTSRSTGLEGGNRGVGRE